MSKVEADIDGLVASIIQKGERAVKGVSDVMQASGNRIRNKARAYAPVDEGNLEDAIYKTSQRGANGRTEVTIAIDGDIPAPQYDSSGAIVKGTADKKVGDYAAAMHEGEYNLGKKSKLKQARLGVRVGRKFLERALNEEREALVAKATAKVKDAFK